MKELNEMVQKKLNEMASEGTLEELIGSQVESLVSKTIESMFRSYGPLGESLKAGLANGLDVSFEEIDYASYNAIMLGAVKSHLDKYFGDQVRKDLDAQIEVLLGPPPKELSLDDLTGNLIKIIKDDFDEDEDAYTDIRVSRNDGYGKNLKISTENGYKTTDVVQLHFGSDGDTIRINHRHTQSFNPTCILDAEAAINAYIFKLYVAKTKITGWDDFNPEDHDTNGEANC